MMTPSKHMALLIGAIGLAACGAVNNAPKQQDPYRAEMMAVCTQNQIERRAKPNRAEKYCACLYDETMKDLSEAERHVARFYLLGQSGIDTKNRNEFKTMDVTAIGTASAAIGAAVKACPRP